MVYISIFIDFQQTLIGGHLASVAPPNTVSLSSPTPSDQLWTVRSASSSEMQKAIQMGQELGVHPLIAHLLTQRGLDTFEDMSVFLQASLKTLPDPALLVDCDKAAKRLLTALINDETMVIYGDYDVDGVTSSSLIWRYFKEAFNAELSVYIPQRLREGYGLNKEAITHLAQRGTQVLVTVDNGSAAVEEVKHAQALGMDVIIIDHHTVSNPEPPAFAHLNPHRETCTYPDKRLAAVGVAFMLLIHLRRLTREDPRFQAAKQPNLSNLLDIVALGTVADVAQLKGVNRALVKSGIETAKKLKRPGILALSEVSKCQLDELSAYHIGHKLGPRLNAAGRIDDARCGFKLLISDHPHETRQLAAHVEQYNQERRDIQERMQKEAIKQAEAYAQDAVIIVSNPDWHHGVVGIIASRIVDRFHRPTIVLGGDQSHGSLRLKGSARSIPKLNLKAALDQCANHLITYGGHAAAAGMSLIPDNLNAFRAALNEVISNASPELLIRPPLIADAELSLQEMSAQLLNQLSILEPLGHGNPAPIFFTRGVRVKASTMSHGKHLKLRFDLPSHLPTEAIGWGMGAQESLCADMVDLCYQPKWDTFRGIRKIVLMLKGIRVHDPSGPKITAAS
jgi:single-stranded-DNA-specific exonuclease